MSKPDPTVRPEAALSPKAMQEIIDLALVAKAQAERLSRETLDELAKASGRDGDHLWDDMYGR